MSYKLPKKLSKTARVIYPAIITMSDGRKVKTGPCKKELVGEHYENVKSYLAHIIDKYDEAKAKKMKEVDDMFKKIAASPK